MGRREGEEGGRERKEGGRGKWKVERKRGEEERVTEGVERRKGEREGGKKREWQKVIETLQSSRLNKGSAQTPT